MWHDSGHTRYASGHEQTHALIWTLWKQSQYMQHMQVLYVTSPWPYVRCSPCTCIADTPRQVCVFVRAHVCLQLPWCIFYMSVWVNLGHEGRHAVDKFTYSITHFPILTIFLSFHCLIIQPQSSFRGMSISHTQTHVHTCMKEGKQTRTTSAVWGHFLFNVIYKQLFSLALFDNHIENVWAAQGKRGKGNNVVVCVNVHVRRQKRKERQRRRRQRE